MSSELTNLLAQRFIARSDVKAVQHNSGAYTPHVDKDGKRLGWTRENIEDHIAGRRTYGHYLLNTDNRCKFFAFDIDLDTCGLIPLEPEPDPATATEADFLSWEQNVFVETEDLRHDWTVRSHPARPWIKKQFKKIAHLFANFITNQLELQCAVAYTGNKGIHVYAFAPRPTPADLARSGALLALEEIGGFEAIRGESFFKISDITSSFRLFTVEVFPKQISLDGKDLGNLMRLPLGINLKNPKDPTFFLDMTTALADFKPLDPAWALGKGAENPFRMQTEYSL